MRDQVYRGHHPEISDFTFDTSVASVFGDMLQRSVPGYGTLLSMLAVLAKKYAQPDTTIYDLGCSLGAASLAMATNITSSTVQIEGIDVSVPMIERARTLVKESGFQSMITMTQEDITKISFKPASIIVLNLTLQFIDMDKRHTILQRISDALLPGGVLIIAEKTTDTSADEIFTDIYYDFKRANGYNELEISQKRTALEKTLVTDTLDEHYARLKAVGFSHSDQWFQALIFRGLIAWK